MIVLYTALLLCLGVLKFATDRRVNRLLRKHARVAQEAERLARAPLFREGTSSRLDALQAAKRQFQLGQVVHKRDRIEACYDTWQMRADRLNALIARVRGWKGKTIPYTFGVLDVGGVLYAIDHLGLAPYLNVGSLIRVLSEWLGR